MHVDLPLTHEVLSHLAGARRPSVSGALTKLAEQGRLERNGRGWVLRGDPPGAADGTNFGMGREAGSPARAGVRSITLSC